MTAVLIVTSNNKQIDKAIVDKDYFVIGRSRRCDLTLDDKNISREHAIVIRNDDGYQIKDRSSRNGTVVNGAQITKQTPLNDGDKIEIGPYKLQFLAGGDARAAEDDESKTRFMPAGEEKGGKPEARRKRKVTREGIRYKLVAVDGPLKGTAYSDWEGDLVFGRASENQVVLPDDAVSHSHARLWQEEGIFHIEDMGSSNGTFVQGTRIKSVRLKNGQRIRIGASTFVFTVVDPEKKRFVLALTAVSALFVLILVAVVVLMTPEDALAPFMAKGIQHIEKGEYVDAKENFEKVLQARPGDLEAQKYIKVAEKGIEREETLLKARTAADNEQYDAALDICYTLQRQYPKYDKAKELEEVINRVKEAQIAFEAKNWPDAVTLLRKAREGYPNSTILARMQARAQAELAAQRNLAKAKEFLAHDQSDSAQELLLGIPSTSAYYAEARGILQDIKKTDTLMGALAAAKTAYRSGNMADALAAIEEGKRQSPGNQELLELERHINGIAVLAKEVENGTALLGSDDVPAVKRMLETCDTLVKAEPDQLNYFRVEAEKLASGLQLRLGELEQNAMTKAQSFVDQGQKREAYKCFMQALEANPQNEKARKAADDIRSETTAECKNLYQQGLIHEDLNQNDLAVAAYEKVMKTALEGDSYYERAKAKLQQLKK